MPHNYSKLGCNSGVICMAGRQRCLGSNPIGGNILLLDFFSVFS